MDEGMKQNNKWKWHFTKDELPKEYKACVIWIPARPWQYEEVGSGIFYKIAWLVRGISKEERAKMKECRRKHEWRSEDEQGNNLVPYYWEEFGPSKYFGQEVIAWTYVEEIENEFNRES